MMKAGYFEMNVKTKVFSIIFQLAKIVQSTVSTVSAALYAFNVRSLIYDGRPKQNYRFLFSNLSRCVIIGEHLYLTWIRFSGLTRLHACSACSPSHTRTSLHLCLAGEEIKDWWRASVQGHRWGRTRVSLLASSGSGETVSCLITVIPRFVQKHDVTQIPRRRVICRANNANKSPRIRYQRHICRAIWNCDAINNWLSKEIKKLEKISLLELSSSCWPVTSTFV